MPAFAGEALKGIGEATLSDAKEASTPVYYYKAMQIALLATMSFLLVATVSAAQPEKPTPDEDWARVNELVGQRVSASQGKGGSAADIEKEKKAQQAASKSLAQLARQFYSKNPSHYRAAEAMRLEALHSLLSISDSDKEHEQAALSIAKSYRENMAHSSAARFEVALISERVLARERLGGVFGYNTAELERIGAKLEIEFGAASEVNNFYAAIARSADMASARRIARKLSDAPAGSAARIEAQSILTRDALLNKPLKWALVNIDDTEPLDLAKRSGKPTVIFIWSPESDRAALEAFGDIASALPRNCEVIYLPLGARKDEVLALKHLVPVKGILCVEDRGALGPTVEQFQVRHTPYVFFLNSTGVLTGFGPITEWRGLAASAR